MTAKCINKQCNVKYRCKSIISKAGQPIIEIEMLPAARQQRCCMSQPWHQFCRETRQTIQHCWWQSLAECCLSEHRMPIS